MFIAGSCGIEGEDDSYDFGTGAGFYIDATEEKWKTNYRMYSYITKEVSVISEGTVRAVKYSCHSHSHSPATLSITRSWLQFSDGNQQC